MELNHTIQPGLTLETSILVEGQHTASQIGSGGLRVLATPAMIGFMEGTAHRLLAQHLPAGFSSVGIQVNIRHLAPTPVGQTIRVRAEVLEVDGLKVTLAVKAWDQDEAIGDGVHQRMVIDEARFLKRVAGKSGSGHLAVDKA